MENLAEALFHGGREAQIKAAMDISKLTSMRRNMLADAGVIAPLVSMLRSQDYEVIEASLFALLSLAIRSERNKIRITKSGALQALIESGSLNQLAIATLLTLSTCTANKSAIAASGVVPLLVQFLNRDDEDDDVGYGGLQARLDAIDTLHNLSTCHQVVLSIISTGAVFSLLQLIYCSEKSSKIAEKAMALLEKIASSSEIGLAQISGAEGGILALVETVEEGSQQSRDHAVGVLLLICKSCRDKYRELILREGAIPGLLQLCVDGTWSSKDRARALLLLLRESSDYGSRRRQLRNGLFERIMREIDSDEENPVGLGTAMRQVEEMIANINV